MFYPRFIKLYSLLDANNMKMQELAELIGMSPDKLSKRMNGKTDWRLEECYSVLDALCIPRKKFHKYFPPIKDKEVLKNEILGN